MRFSSIDWRKYDLKPLAEKTRLSEQEIFGIFDSEAGMHMVNGICSKPRGEITSNTAKMIYRLMEGAVDFDMDDDEDEDSDDLDDMDADNDNTPTKALNLPATMEEIRIMVDGILSQLGMQWPAR